MTISDTDGPTRFGIFMPPMHRLGISPTVMFENDLELIESADRLGLQEAWVGEHHSGGHEPVAAPEVFLTAASQRTRNIMLGTAVNSLPYHNPFTLASRLVLLDHLSHGRVIMGFGPGASASDAYMLGIDPSSLRERMQEAAGVIVRLMRGEVVTHESEWFSLNEAYLQIRPFQVPSMEMVVAAVVSPSGPRTAGNLGIGMINMSATAAQAFEALKNHWATLEAEAEKSGATVARSQWRLAGMTHIADTEEQAREDLKYGFEEIWRHVGQVGPLPISSAATFDELLDEAIEGGLITVGTPDTLVRVVRELAKQTGGFGTFIMTLTGFTDFGPRMRALELYARHVVPEFRGQLKGLRNSNDWVLGQRDGEGTIWKTQSQAAIAKATDDYQAERGAAPTGT